MRDYKDTKYGTAREVGPLSPPSPIGAILLLCTSILPNPVFQDDDALSLNARSLQTHEGNIEQRSSRKYLVSFLQSTQVDKKESKRPIPIGFCIFYRSLMFH